HDLAAWSVCFSRAVIQGMYEHGHGHGIALDLSRKPNWQNWQAHHPGKVPNSGGFQEEPSTRSIGWDDQAGRGRRDIMSDPRSGQAEWPIRAVDADRAAYSESIHI